MSDLPTPRTPAEVGVTVQRLLRQAPAFQRLDATTQAALAESMAKVADYLSRDPLTGGEPDGGPSPLASQLAPDLRQRLSPQRDGRTQTPQQATGRPPAPASAPAAGAPPAAGPTGRVGEVARATLNAIDFPSFVGSLIQGTFQAIVDASIQQMEAYAELLRNVAGTVDRFMADNVSDGTARDYLTEQHGSVLTRETHGDRPVLALNPQRAPDEELPSFFKDLGFERQEDISPDAVEEVIVPAARRTLAEQRQKTLATMVLMGINRVVVGDGELTAKLQFHIDASESADLRFDQRKTTAGNLSGRAGRSPFTANAIMVNTTSLNAQSDINVRADLTGQVTVRFRSETFPLERFADSAAIQLIDSHARVPAPPPAAAPAGDGTAASAATSAGPTAPAAPATAPGAGTAQSLAAGAAPVASTQDPWEPEA